MVQEVETNEAEQGPPPARAALLLPGPARWLGSTDGYSPDDLTSIQVAYARFEVARPDPDHLENEVLELRIHGVGGASPEANLETPSTLMVAGDKRAGFYRAWFPGQGRADTPLREAYCWGRFSYAAVTSAVWMLLLPFALVNVASWALPAPHREGKSTKQEDWRWARRVSRVLLRLLGLVLTAAFTITACFLLVVIVARQAAYDRSLPGWLDWYEGLRSSQRESVALALVVLVIVALRIFSGYTTHKYEKWSPGDQLPDQTTMRLSAPNMWQGSESVRRQQFCHVFTAGAVILTFAALALNEGSYLRDVGTVTAAGMVGFAALLLAAPGCDRLWVTQDQPGTPHQSGWSWALPNGLQSLLEGLTLVGALLVVGYVWIAGPDYHSGEYGLEDKLLHAPLVTEFALLIALSLVLVLQQPWKQTDVFAFGFLSVLVAGLAVAVSSIFGGALLLTVTNVLSSPSLVQEKNASSIFVPSVVASGSLAFLATIVALIFLVGGLLIWWARLRKRLVEVVAPAPAAWKHRDIPVAKEYEDQGLPTGDAYAQAVGKIAWIWSRSRMTDLAAVIGAALAVPTLLVQAIAEWFALFDPEQLDRALPYAQIGTTATVTATVVFIGLLRGALVSEAQRRKFAFFWDVVNFWPRAAHPFSPPCYAERVVPEVTTRIRRIVGDQQRGDKDPAAGQVASERDPSRVDGGFEPHRPVVLNGYSQGSPISVAVVAQLPKETHERVALLTLACPAHRLYGRAFPLYFGPDQLEELLKELTNPDGITRWINMCRRSDYVGGPVGMGIDEWILDPPALWPSTNPTRVPAHLHSDWFADPQTHPNVAVLAGRLPQLPGAGTEKLVGAVDAAPHPQAPRPRSGSASEG